MNKDIMNAELETEPLQNSISDLDNKDIPLAGLYEWVEAAVFSLLFIVLVFSFLFRIVGVEGDSMNDTLHHEDRLLITNMMYTPQRGDIVIINQHTKKPLVKRIIAVSGDTLKIDETTHQVLVNNEVQNEHYIKGKTYPIYFSTDEQKVPPGYVFVMGDNRENSMDSRMIGFIKQNDIMGKAFFRFFPLNKAEKLY